MEPSVWIFGTKKYSLEMECIFITKPTISHYNAVVTVSHY